MILDRRSVLAGSLGGLIAPTLAIRARAHDRKHQVTIQDFVFNPSHLVVHPGDTVTFTNHDLAPHTATAQDGSWNTGELVRGDSATLTVSDDWTGEYFCAFHPSMTAILAIEDH